MKIISASQIKDVDQGTVEAEGITSYELMERAALACVRRLLVLIDNETPIYVFCGMGNNGGDGLAIARLLRIRNYNVSVFIVRHREEFSADAKMNYDLLIELCSNCLVNLKTYNELLSIEVKKKSIAIDAILGTGTNKEVDGLLGDTISFVNQKFKKIVSIDVPSGLLIDQNSTSNKHIIRSSVVLSLQFPKLAYLLPENAFCVPHFDVLDIGLNEKEIAKHNTPYFFISKRDIKPLMKKRGKFSHKGTYGHALLMAGSKGKAGAAIIAAKACLRSGAGLLTVYSTREVNSMVVNHLPEAMTQDDVHSDFISEIEKPERFDAIGFGPGAGLNDDTQRTLKKLLQYYKGYLVIDADGLNILAENKTWLNFLPPNTILTPHPKEWERLNGKSENDFERLKDLKLFCQKYNCIVILKGAYSVIVMPDGNFFFNSSGNPGLAKGGSGDALTGIILGLLTRGYNAPQSALIGTFIHGYAADLCLKKNNVESLLISDVISMLPKAFRKLDE
jgi:ADP-dependent NAD(P)H-hydrate dehydratase / NAD(P)H-hydrate epimerase